MLNVLEYLEKSAEKFPDKTAYADKQRQVTYKELLLYSQTIATNLLNKIDNINNRPIAILAEHNVNTLIAFFGVLQSGNFYVPLDSKMPKKRLQAILKQLDTPIILYSDNDEQLANELKEIAPIANINELLTGQINIDVISFSRSKVLDIDPIYMIFTSGSTGTPKGIVISHRNVIDFIEWMSKECEFTNNDIMGNQAPFYFDLSVKDIYLTLKCGATCYILDKKLFMFPALLVKELNKLEVTSLVWATSAFHLVANSKIFEKESIKTLKKVILGGEALRAKQLNIWQKAMPDVKYTNLYGPTEVTVDCTFYHIDKPFADDEIIPIGTACKNKEVFLLDADLKPVEKGQTGEICVRGIGLAHGYFKDSEKTNNAFIQDPRNPYYPQKIYRTGDLAYQNEQGLFVFMSRKDGQIKHMGYRIELGELEHALNALEKIESAITFLDEKNDKIICYYQGDLSPDDINKQLKDYLPKYMLPNILFKLDNMPYNANGKINRVKLKEDYYAK